MNEIGNRRSASPLAIATYVIVGMVFVFRVMDFFVQDRSPADWLSWLTGLSDMTSDYDSWVLLSWALNSVVSVLMPIFALFAILSPILKLRWMSLVGAFGLLSHMVGLVIWIIVFYSSGQLDAEDISGRLPIVKLIEFEFGESDVLQYLPYLLAENLAFVGAVLAFVTWSLWSKGSQSQLMPAVNDSTTPEVTYCSACGAQSGNSAKFCDACGNSLSANSQMQ